ncbi:arginine--tRNA ligase [Jeotgalibaca sp. A122]|uniref:arginine--tRNA ligase n=1 Tax=Jeotgalibaca sp. A122 TaxID=3457322 RepID=UPI003FD0AFAF
MDFKENILKALFPLVGDHLSEEEITDLIEVPSNPEFGDLAFPVFALAKIYHQAPNQIAKELVEKMNTDFFESVQTIGPYINFKFNRKTFSNIVLNNVLTQREHYGYQDLGKGGNVPVDMSSPNIAKPMSMGHLRSTVIGNAVGNIMEKLNYNVIRINHLGDWGTQFGKLIVAYKKWGDEEVIKRDPVNELVKLYVDFHDKADLDPTLEEDARVAFKKLEEGDEEMYKLWNWFKEESLQEFNKIYAILGIAFDSYNGESFYNDKMQEILDDLEKGNISTVENGATIVRLDEEGLPPALIKKSDGATLYLTRDLATAYYRKRTYDFVESVYVVGNEQANHFKQLKAVLKRLGHEWADNMHHVPFGLITLGGKKLSTRKGKIILLEDVLNEAMKLAKEQILQKNPELENQDEVARQVGVGAVIFHDLKKDRLNSFDFKIEEIVQFEGETGPYVQYSYVRARSLLEKYAKKINPEKTFGLEDDYSWEIIKKIEDYGKIIKQAAAGYEPSVLTKYLIQVAQVFNKYYGNTRILEQNEQLESRMALVEATSIVLKDGLHLLGIEVPEKM